MYKQDVTQNSEQSIVPDLAISWSWNEEGTAGSSVVDSRAPSSAEELGRSEAPP
jgi:hypothetical protein